MGRSPNPASHKDYHILFMFSCSPLDQRTSERSKSIIGGRQSSAPVFANAISMHCTIAVSYRTVVDPLFPIYQSIHRHHHQQQHQHLSIYLSIKLTTAHTRVPHFGARVNSPPLNIYQTPSSPHLTSPLLPPSNQ